MIDGYQITATGTTVTSGSVTARVAIPFDNGGVNQARYCRLQTTGFCYVRVGNATVNATTNDLLLSPNEAAYLITANATNIAYLQETASAKLNIVAIEC
jgi:hypothetical protein